MGDRVQRSYLFDAVKRVDLRVFIEREAGAKFEQKSSNNWAAICPMHRDSQPSFSVTRHHDGIWVYHCFGCQSGGTIIDFCKEYFDLVTTNEALVMAAEKEGIKCDESLIIKATKEAKVQSDRKYDINLAHFVASSNCRKLLRQAEGDEKVVSWVANAYKKMNAMLDDERTSPADISKIGDGAMRMIGALHEINRGS